MIVSVEIPAFKGAWLQRCIDSVLYQSSPNWRLSVLWDGGDELSRRVLEKLEKRGHPNVSVHFGPNRGIAKCRRILSENSQGDFILPLDDDDVLPFHAVERFLCVAEQKPWAALIRGQRRFIDLEGRILDVRPWFPFGPRLYQNGMVTDLPNHCQPYLIRRSAYERTAGWEGFEDFHQAGEDCDVYLKLEEEGSIELLDEVLYYYRINPKRASLGLTNAAAFEMWRRLADKTIERIGLPLRRTNEKPPYVYERTPRPPVSLDVIDFLVLTEGEVSVEMQPGSFEARLRARGVPADAFHAADAGNVAALNTILRRTQRPFVCILADTTEVARSEEFESFLGSFDAADLDLAAPIIRAQDGSVVAPGGGLTRRIRASLVGPTDSHLEDIGQPTRAPWLHDRLMLVRREVVRAVGGIDDGFREPSLALADFCLKARERDFKTGYLSTEGFTAPPGGPMETEGPDLRRLHAKWGSRPEIWGGETEELPSSPGVTLCADGR